MHPDGETDQAKDADQTQTSEVNVTYVGREKEGHCQLSFADPQVKAPVAGAEPIRKTRYAIQEMTTRT